MSEVKMVPFCETQYQSPCLWKHLWGLILTSSSQLQNATKNTGAEKKSYVLIFGQRTVVNIDNSTKIVSSIVGNNLVKIEEEFLEEISLTPSQ